MLLFVRSVREQKMFIWCIHIYIYIYITTSVVQAELIRVCCRYFTMLVNNKADKCCVLKIRVTTVYVAFGLKQSALYIGFVCVSLVDKEHLICSLKTLTWIRSLYFTLTKIFVGFLTCAWLSSIWTTIVRIRYRKKKREKFKRIVYHLTRN